jgi:nitroreductase
MIASPAVSLSVIDAARTRRSIRQYTPEPVARGDLRQILETVSLAPSAFNVQPWRFVVVEDADLKNRLAAAAFNQRQVVSAPAVFVLYSDVADVMRSVADVVHPGLPEAQRAKTEHQIRGFLEGKSESEREDWVAAQANIALGYLLLAAAALDYQTSAMGGFDPAAVKEVLGLPASARVNALVAIGRGAEDGFPHHRLPVDRFATFR